MINSKLSTTAPYYQRLDHRLLRFVRGRPQRVLEIGCGTGESLVYLKQQGATHTVGIELRPDIAAMAAARPEIDELLTGDIETLDLPYAPGTFDLVIASHVLEHLRDPWTVLRRLHPLLKPGGQLLGALPNIRYFAVVFPLFLWGKWEYQPLGVMDWTHLRFFTASTIQSMLLETGFTVERIHPQLASYQSKVANGITLNLFRHFWAMTYNFSAGRPSVLAHGARKEEEA